MLEHSQHSGVAPDHREVGEMIQQFVHRREAPHPEVELVSVPGDLVVLHGLEAAHGESEFQRFAVASGARPEQIAPYLHTAAFKAVLAHRKAYSHLPVRSQAARTPRCVGTCRGGRS